MFEHFDMYRGAAFYVPSANDSESLFAIHGTNVREEDFIRFDRTLFRRRLPANLSAATVFGLGDQKLEVTHSKRLKSEHKCLHIRLGGTGVLQFVFANQAGVDSQIKQAISLAENSELSRANQRFLGELAQEDLVVETEDQLGVLPEYQENMVIMELDLSGFSKEAIGLGQTRMEIFGQNLRQSITDMTAPLNPSFVSYQGDGLRIGFPFDRQGRDETITAVKNLAMEIKQNYPRMAKKFDPAVKCYVRIAVRAGEVIETNTGHRGFVLSDIANDIKYMPRNLNCLSFQNV